MTFERIFTLPEESLKRALHLQLKKHGYKAIHNKEKFLYAEGDAPYMLVAHLDTVHKELPSIICYSRDGNYMMSPQGIGGDDRCGVYIILSLLATLQFKPHIVFTMEEEKGGVGAKEFVSYMKDIGTPDLKYIIEYDRKGNKDCVFYQCDNSKFVKFVESFGFKEARGTFSDISVIAPAFETAAVNLSSGYYNPHTCHEYVCISDMKNVIATSIKMLNTDSEKFKYIPVKYEEKNSYTGAIKINVSFIPSNSVWVWDMLEQDYRINRNYELAVDKFGNLYKYTKAFRCYYPITNSMEIFPLDEDFDPKYDAKSSSTIIAYDF